MGEVEKCPKCKGKLRFVRSEYRQAEGGRLPDSYSCMICGFYKEVMPDNTVPIELKKNKYPKTRKPQNETGWLRQLVRDNYDLLNDFRETQRIPWKDVYIRVGKIVPKFQKTTVCGLTTAFYRIREQKRHA